MAVVLKKKKKRILLPIANAGKHGFDPWVGKIPWRRKWQHSSILAWEMLWIEQPHGLQSMWLQKSPTQLN